MSISQNKSSSDDHTQFDDESTLVTFVQRHRLALLGGALLGGAFGLALSFSLPLQWEAVARVQISQLGGSTPVEPPLRVVERAMQKSFKDDALRRIGVSPDGSNLNAGLLRDSLKVTVAKSDLVGMRVRGASPDEALRFADALITELARVHAKLAEPTLQRWRSEIKDNDAELERAEHEIERLRTSLEKRSAITNPATLFQSVLASNILLSRDTELRGLRERKRALQEQLSPERTFPTAAMGQIEVSIQPVFPKKSLFAVGGLAIGILGVVMLLMLRPAGTRKKHTN